MSQLPKHLLGLSKGELEGMCVDCGLCCYASAPFAKGNVFVPELRCKHLDFDEIGKSQCEVYENRHEVAPWCLPLGAAIEKGIFPEKCPYVAGMDDYCGSAVLSDEAYAMVAPNLRKSILEQGQPPWASKSNWESFRDPK